MTTRLCTEPDDEGGASTRGLPAIQTTPVRLPVALIGTFTAAAKVRNMSERQLIRTILMRVSEDNLFSAILDDGV